MTKEAIGFQYFEKRSIARKFKIFAGGHGLKFGKEINDYGTWIVDIYLDESYVSSMSALANTKSKKR